MVWKATSKFVKNLLLKLQNDGDESEYSENVSIRQLLARVTLANTRRVYKFSSFIKSVPFELDSATSNRMKVKLYEKWWNRWLWYGVNLIIFLYWFFQMFSFTRQCYRYGLTAETAVHVVYFCMYQCAAIFFTCMAKDPQGVVFLINQLNYVQENSIELGLGSKSWASVPFSIFSVQYFACSVLFVAPPPVLYFYSINPNGSPYFHSLLPEIWKGQVSFAAMFLVEILTVYWTLGVLTVYFCYWCAIVFQNILWLKSMLNASPLSEEELMTMTSEAEYTCFENKLHSFRTIGILNRLHNNLNANFSFLFTALMILTSTLFTYCALETFHIVSIIIYVIFPSMAFFSIFLIVIFYPYITKWQQLSGELLEKWRIQVGQSSRLHPIHKEVLYKEIHALQPLRNKLSIFSYTSLGTSQACVEEIFNALLLLLSF